MYVANIEQKIHMLFVTLHVDHVYWNSCQATAFRYVPVTIQPFLFRKSSCVVRMAVVFFRKLSCVVRMAVVFFRKSSCVVRMAVVFFRKSSCVVRMAVVFLSQVVLRG